MTHIGFLHRLWTSSTRDDILTLAAALSFYLSIAFAPFILILISIAAFLDATSTTVFVNSVSEVTSPAVGGIVESLILNASASHSAGVVSLIIGFLFGVFSVSSIFVQMNSSLDRIFYAKRKKMPFRKIILKRLALMLFILAFAAAIIVSLSVSAMIQSRASGNDVAIWIDQLISIATFTFLFAITYRFVPDKRLSIRKIMLGSLCAGTFFTLGKLLVSIYLQVMSASSYSALGSLLAVLIWFYYSSIVLFLGAEVMKTA